MDGFNPYAPPRASLLEPRQALALREAGWRVDELRVLAALAGGEAFGVAVLCVLLLWAHLTGPDFLHLFALCLLLLWSYLLQRLRQLLRDRHGVHGLGMPLIVQTVQLVLLLGLHALQLDTQTQLHDAYAGMFTALQLSWGITLAALGWPLARLAQGSGELRWFGRLLLAGGLGVSSLFLVTPALALLFLSIGLLARLFRNAASELQQLDARPAGNPSPAQ